jgi:LmbE family N-acetylglucosaminyl deacetylase
MNGKKILVLCAHPDDETLGLGGTLNIHTNNGDFISVIIFADGESSRNKSSKEITQRRKQSQQACKILGIQNIKFLNYKDQILDTIPTLELAKKIEKEIEITTPEIIYTHYWGDVNQDHRKIFEATLIATRPVPYSKIRKVICYETPSSTEWGINDFHPNLFVNIEKSLEKKLNALQKYEHEIQTFPHPRSLNSIENRAKYWGSSVGLRAAEAFVLFREIKSYN